MNTFLKIFAVICLVIASSVLAYVAVTPSQASATVASQVTFSNAQIYFDGNSKISPVPCSSVSGATLGATCDGGYYPDQTTATKLCQLKGYNAAVNFTTQAGFFTSCADNFMWQWNGSSANYVWACNQNTGIDTVTCGNNSTPITCSSNSDCNPSNGYIGNPYCQGNSIFQTYRAFTCQNPGTASSSCVSSDAGQLKNACAANQTCTNGSCVNQTTITCSSNTDCGTNAYTGSPFCQGNNVYQNYITYTCNNAGSATSYCSNNTASQLKNNCTGSQTCSNGSCGGNSCTYHSYQQCYGNYLYWYDSCGVQQDSTYCPNGCSGNYCTNNNNYVTVQSNPATNLYNGQATLNGYLYNNGNNNYTNTCNSYVWFQYGPTSSYGLETTHQSQNYSGAFSQVIYMNSGSVYHFRAVAQGCTGGLVYGQDTTTYGSNNNSSNLIVSNTVRNLTNGSGFATSVSAAPGDMLMFMLTLQANGSDSQNVIARDYLPANLIYNNQLTVACTTSTGNYTNCNTNGSYTGNISSGVTIGTIYSGQTYTITYQAQVASASNFSYGSTTLTDNASITSSNGTNQTPNSSVIVTRTAVYGASSISTGLTNNFWVDSFFLPLLLALIGLWCWRTGMFFGLEKWLDGKKKQRRGLQAEKELAMRIGKIQKAEKA